MAPDADHVQQEANQNPEILASAGGILDFVPAIITAAPANAAVA
jgi:hypothetical protein